MSGKGVEFGGGEDTGERGTEFEKDIGGVAVVGSEKLFEPGEGGDDGLRVAVRGRGGGYGFGGERRVDGGNGETENSGKGGEGRIDVAIRIDGGFGLRGGFSKRVRAEIGGGTFERVGEPLGGRGIADGEGVANVGDSGGLGVGEALEERFVAFAISAGAFESGDGIDAGDGEGCGGFAGEG